MITKPLKWLLFFVFLLPNTLYTNQNSIPKLPIFLIDLNYLSKTLTIVNNNKNNIFMNHYNNILFMFCILCICFVCLGIVNTCVSFVRHVGCSNVSWFLYYELNHSFLPCPASVYSSDVMIPHQKCPLNLRAEVFGPQPLTEFIVRPLKCNL